MSNIWSDLPNAAHIDRILVSLKANPKIWADASWDADAYYSDSWDAAWDATWKTAMSADRDAAAYFGGIDAAKDASYFTAWYAIIALFAYDDAAKYLDLPLDQLKMLYALTEHPAALLLQPAVIAFSMEKALA